MFVCKGVGDGEKGKGGRLGDCVCVFVCVCVCVCV